MGKLRGYIAAHRKWIVGAALSAAAGFSTYAWPSDPWISTAIGVVAVGLGVNIVPNRGTEHAPSAPVEVEKPAV